MAAKKRAVAGSRGPWRYVLEPGAGLSDLELVCWVSPERVAALLDLVRMRSTPARWDNMGGETVYFDVGAEVMVTTSPSGYPVLYGWVPFAGIVLPDGRRWTIVGGWDVPAVGTVDYSRERLERDARVRRVPDGGKVV